MNQYETMYILRHGLDDATRESLIEKFAQIVTADGGQIVSINKMGMRRFAYPINYQREGFYVLMKFDAQPTVPAELERQMRITDELMRFIVVRDDARSDIVPVAEPVAEAAAEPVAEAAAEPVAEAAAEPVAEAAAEPVAEPVAEVAAEPVAEPVAEEAAAESAE